MSNSPVVQLQRQCHVRPAMKAHFPRCMIKPLGWCKFWVILIEKFPLAQHLSRREEFMFSSFLILLDVHRPLVGILLGSKRTKGCSLGIQQQHVFFQLRRDKASFRDCPFRESSQEFVYPSLISQKHWFEIKEKHLTKLFEIRDPLGNSLKLKILFGVALFKHLTARNLIQNDLCLHSNLQTSLAVRALFIISNYFNSNPLSPL